MSRLKYLSSEIDSMAKDQAKDRIDNHAEQLATITGATKGHIQKLLKNRYEEIVKEQTTILRDIAKTSKSIEHFKERLETELHMKVDDLWIPTVINGIKNEYPHLRFDDELKEIINESE